MSKKHIVLYGTSDELISLRLMELVNEAHKEGKDVVYLDGKDSSPSEISEAVGVGLFGDANKLVVIHRIGSMKGSDKVVSQDEVPCVFVAGKTLPKILTSLKKKESFEEPKSYKKKEWCEAFLIKIAGDYGVKLSQPLASSIVSRVGTSLGVLRWEALKLKYASESAEPTPREVLSVLAPLSELDGVHLVDSVFTGDPKQFLKICGRFETIRNGDPTIAVSTGLLHSSVVNTLEVRLLLDKGVTSSQEIGLKIGQSPWLVEKVFLPRAKVFSQKKLRDLLGVLYRSENMGLSGVIGAWESLKVGIVGVMIS